MLLYFFLQKWAELPAIKTFRSINVNREIFTEALRLCLPLQFGQFPNYPHKCFRRIGHLDWKPNRGLWWI